MSFQRVPEDFMKGIFIAPHNFSDPQNPIHGEYVNMQLKNDLYYSAISQISNVQFSSSGSEQEWIKVQQIKQCQGPDPLDGFGTGYKTRKGRIPRVSDPNDIDILSCQDWKVALHQGDKKQLSVYRVKILQTKTDIFRAHILPPTFYKVLKDLWVN